MVCALLFHSLDFFSFFFYPIKLFLFNLLDLNERLLLVDNFLFAHSWRGKSWPSISLSMKDYGAASRAAKSPLRTLLFWKTSGISFFSRRKCSFLWGTGFSSNFISHCLFVERHWVGQWGVVSMKILLMLMRDSSLLLETSWTSERLVG